MYKYALHPGYVYANDGDRHWITCARLIELYKVNPKDCISVEAHGVFIGPDAIHLRPDDNGFYKLPEEEE